MGKKKGTPKDLYYVFVLDSNCIEDMKFETEQEVVSEVNSLLNNKGIDESDIVIIKGKDMMFEVEEKMYIKIIGER